MAEYIGKRIVPRHDGEWDKSQAYEAMVIVLDPSTGDSYASKVAVPAGIDLSNTEYWALCGVFNAQLKETYDKITADNDATENAIKADNDATENVIKADNDATEAAVKEDNAATKQHVDDSVAHMEKIVETARQEYESGNEIFQDTAENLNTRMDSIAGGATTDTEVLDARVDEEGKTYPTVGSHIRAAEAAKADKIYAYGLPFSYQGAVNINTSLHQVEFPGNFLILSPMMTLVTKPDPVPYNAEALLTYICYSITGGALVTHDWHEKTGMDEIVVFAVAGTNPIKSYGLFPFLVDGLQPFADGTIGGNALSAGAVSEEKLLDGAVTRDKLGTASVSADKLYPDAFLSLPFDAAITPYTYSKTATEIMEDGTFHYSRADDESGWLGGGFSVPKATRFEKLYIEMEYQADQPMHFYVIASNLVHLGSIPATNGEVKTVHLEVPKEKLDATGHNENYLRIAFTYNQAFDLYIYSVHARYVETDSDYFGADYEKLKARAASNEEKIAALSSDVTDLTQNAEEIEGQLTKAYTGKKILFMGDSITALGTGERGWLKYFNEIIKPASFVNTAVASARWCDYPDTVYDGNPVFNGEDANHNNVMGNQVEKLLRGKDPDHEGYSEVAEYADFDMILIACGTNDGTPTAEIESSFTSSNEAVPLEDLDRTIMPSAFRYAIENLQTMYPDALIFICTPIQGYITTRSYSSIKAKGDYLKTLAGRMSVEVIDTFECGVCDIYEQKGGNGRYLIDGLHPNAAGAKVMGRYNAKMVISRYV